MTRLICDLGIPVEKVTDNVQSTVVVMLLPHVQDGDIGTSGFVHSQFMNKLIVVKVILKTLN